MLKLFVPPKSILIYSIEEQTLMIFFRFSFTSLQRIDFLTTDLKCHPMYNIFLSFFLFLKDYSKREEVPPTLYLQLKYLPKFLYKRKTSVFLTFI